MKEQGLTNSIVNAIGVLTSREKTMDLITKQAGKIAENILDEESEGSPQELTMKLTFTRKKTSTNIDIGFSASIKTSPLTQKIGRFDIFDDDQPDLFEDSQEHGLDVSANENAEKENSAA